MPKIAFPIEYTKLEGSVLMVQCSCCGVFKKEASIKRKTARECSYCVTNYYKSKDPIRYKEYQKTSKKRNGHKYKESTRIWRQEHKVEQYARKQELRKLKPWQRKGESKFRKSQIKRACPKWLNRKEIYAIYRNCPEGCQVDHVIPILNDNISGLHVPWNLQYLTPFENNSKNNSWDGTYENNGWKNNANLNSK